MTHRRHNDDVPVMQFHGDWRDDMPLDPDDAAERERRLREGDDSDDESRHRPRLSAGNHNES